ncbi:MAG: hypothetical protein E7211_21270, partial [Clostridium lundense]|nr:hypothetical protein [Clostridium lundense]
MTDVTKQWKCILLIPLACLLFVSITLLVTPPATGYEYSIYEPYSPVFWIISGSIFIFPFIYLYLSLSKEGRMPFSRKSIYSLLLIAATNLVLLLHIPKSRGYIFITSGDGLHHIGYCVDILNTGHLLTENHYPLSHVGISITSLLADIQPSEIVLSTAATFAIVFTIGIFSISRVLRFSKPQSCVITAFSIFPILGYWFTFEPFMPSTIGWSLIPILLLLVYRVIFHTTHTVEYLIITLILSVACWFVHPETVVFSAIMIMVIVGFCLFVNIITRKRFYPIRLLPSIVILIFLVTGFMAFFLSTRTGMSQLESYLNIFSNVIGSVSTAVEPVLPTISLDTTINTVPNQIPTASSDTGDKFAASILSIFGEKSPFAILFTSTASLSRKIVLLIVAYGQLLTMSALCLIIALWGVIGKKIHHLDKRYIIILVLFFTFVVISLVFLTLGTAIG